MKKLFILILWILFFSIVFARDDCNFVRKNLSGTTGLIANGGFVNPLNSDSIYPNEAYFRALYNLKAYCCDNHLIDLKSCEVDKNMFSDVYPESWFLYDHLVDVGLRRLDAENNLIYGLNPDSLGLERRNYINGVANNSDANFALSMSNEFKKYWNTENKDYIGLLYFDNWDVFHNYNNIKLKSIVSDPIYNSINLYQKYKELCGVAASIYLDESEDNNMDKVSSIKWNFDNCQLLVSKRIQDEVLYTKTLIKKKSTALLKKSINAYAIEYYAKNRLLNLQETIFAISDLFLTVAKMAPEWTFECN